MRVNPLSIRLFCLVIVCCLSASAVWAQTGETPMRHVAPSLRRQLHVRQHQPAAQRAAGEAKPLTLVVELTPAAGVQQADLEALGCRVRWMMPTSAAVTAPLSVVPQLAALPGVRSVREPRQMQAHNKETRPYLGVETVADPAQAAQAGLTQAYQGRGVLVTCLDCGIEPGHLNFRGEDGKTRIRHLVTYGPDENLDDWRTEYRGSDEVALFKPFTDVGHATHVLGTAGGSYTDNGQQGMAPQAQLAVCDLTRLNDAAMVDAILRLGQLADSLDMPMVANMSIGELVGFKDGCDPVSQAIAQVTDNGTRPGRVFSVSSANSGANNSSTFCDFGQRDTMYVQYDHTSASEKPIPGPDGQPVTVQPQRDGYDTYVYIESGVTADVQLALFDVERKVRVSDDECCLWTALYRSADGDTVAYQDEGFELIGNQWLTLRKLNEMMYCDESLGLEDHTCLDGTQKQLAYAIFSGMSVAMPSHLHLGIAITCPDRKAQAVGYLYRAGSEAAFTTQDMPFVAQPTSDYSLSSLACHRSAISVGSVTHNNRYTNFLSEPGQSFSFGGAIDEVSDFSSYGYTRDGEHRIVPDVLAPGTCVVSSVNRFYSRYFYDDGSLRESSRTETNTLLHSSVNYGGVEYWWQVSHGTSMSSPAVAGIIALWLEADPTLSALDVRDLLAHSSRPYHNPDVHEAKCSRFGIVDALAGLQYLQAHAAIEAPASEALAPEPCYDLLGRPCAAQQGIYIKGGKVVLRRP